MEKAAVDSGFLGAWVCGEQRWRALEKAFAERGAKVEDVKCSGNLYRFGSGVGKAVRTVKVPVQVGEVKKAVEVDVLRGALPLLAGGVAMKDFRLLVDGAAGQVLQRVDGDAKLRVVDTFGRGELPGVSCYRRMGLR